MALEPIRLELARDRDVPGGNTGPEAPHDLRALNGIRRPFRRLAERTSHAVGSPWAFALAVATIAVWGVTGPYFGYSDTWQLFINTGTTIVTFLMVFLIQNTQNRDAMIVALKLDELLRGVEGARTGLVQLDHMSDEELEDVKQEFARISEKYAPLIDDHLAHVERELEARRQRD